MGTSRAGVAVSRPMMIELPNATTALYDDDHDEDEDEEDDDDDATTALHDHDHADEDDNAI